MVVTAHKRGHLIQYEGKWVYADNGEDIQYERPCKRCGLLPTPDGYDACLGYIPNVISACCGHGVEKSYKVNYGRET